MPDDIFGRYLFALPEYLPEYTVTPYQVSASAVPYTRSPEIPAPPRLTLPEQFTSSTASRTPPQSIAGMPINLDVLEELLSSDKANPAFYKFVLDTLGQAFNLYNAYKANQIKAQQAAIAPLVNMYKNLVTEQHNLANVISQATNPEIVKYMLPKWAELESTKKKLLSQFPMLQAIPMDEEAEANNLQTQKMEILSQLNKR